MDGAKAVPAGVDSVKTYVHSSTQLCAIRKSCVPCHYKIFPTGTFCSVSLPPNQRPEQCPRAKSGPYDGLYKPHHRVLTLGDGDFSFSLSIAKNVKFTTGCLVATSHESKEQLLTTYNAVGVKDILKQLEMRSITTLHDVDAMDISSTKEIEKRYYDAIVWNFPCVRAENGADGQSSEIEINKLLLSNFFLNVQDYLRPGSGQLHITHKTFEPFSWWEISKLADECGFDHYCSIVFDRTLYPGYVNRKVLDKKSFPLHDARTFVFMAKTSTKCDEMTKGNINAMPTDVCGIVNIEGSAAPDSKLNLLSDPQIQKEFLISVKRITGPKNVIQTTKKSRKAEMVADSSFSNTVKKRK